MIVNTIFTIIESFKCIASARMRWGFLSDAEKSGVMERVAVFRSDCLQIAFEREYPWLDLPGGYVVSQPAWEQFTARAKVEDLMNAMMELDDPKSSRVRQSGVVLLEWPDPTEGMFDDND